VSISYKGVTVAFEQDIREEDAHRLLDAIRQIRGVLAVEPIHTDPSEDWITRTRVVSEMSKDIRDVLRKWNK
jgi:hypothetical protein